MGYPKKKSTHPRDHRFLAQLLALAAQDFDQALAEPAGRIFRALEEVLGTDAK